MPGLDRSGGFLTATVRIDRRRTAWAIAPHLLFIVLLAFNVVRTFRHAMWRDEMQVFLLGACSPTLSDLFRNLEYETHPDLWHLLVWLAARIYDAPVSMQVVHVVLATIVWLLVWRLSPFRTVDKILLLIGYFLFFEYFVVSRNYVLVALFGFAVMAMRQLRPRAVLSTFALLGLLANSMVLGTIWSMVMAARLALQPDISLRSRLAGSALYLVLLVAAVAAIIPVAGTTPHGAHLRFDPTHFDGLALIPAGAMFPVDPNWLLDTIKFLLDPRGAALPQFWNPNPLHQILSVAGGGAAHTLVIIGLLLFPPLACGLIVRDWKLAAEFAVTYFGIVMFAALWDVPGLARHHGVVFVAFAATVWMAKARGALDGWREQVWRALLIISACGGLLTLTSELRPFSNGRNTAEWLQRNRLEDAFIMGSRDTTMATISGYLRRPIYYLECECEGRFIVWNAHRTLSIDTAEIMIRAQRALDKNSGRDAILIVNRMVAPEDIRRLAPNLTLTLLQSFTGAVEETENYFVFRVAALK
jgi:hypothetical protein